MIKQTQNQTINYEDEENFPFEKKVRSWFLPALGILTCLYVIDDCYFIIQPNEMSGVRRLGTVRTSEPLQPGIHLKFPFIETVDKISVSINSMRVDGLKVYTNDNQKVTIGIGITYRIPQTAAFKLLYDVGRSGNVDVEHNVKAIIADRALRIFAKRNTVKISEEREQIGADTRVIISESVKSLFGIEIYDLQIPIIDYSDTFVDSVEAAVKAKNDAIAAENTINRIRYEGEQKIISAKADAEAKVTRARAERDAAILAAEGDAKSIELRTTAEAQGIKNRGQSLKENERIVDLEYAQHWNGQLPQTMFGGNGAVPFFNLNGHSKQ